MGSPVRSEPVGRGVVGIGMRTVLLVLLIVMSLIVGWLGHRLLHPTVVAVDTRADHGRDPDHTRNRAVP